MNDAALRRLWETCPCTVNCFGWKCLLNKWEDREGHQTHQETQVALHKTTVNHNVSTLHLEWWDFRLLVSVYTEWGHDLNWVTLNDQWYSTTMVSVLCVCQTRIQEENVQTSPIFIWALKNYYHTPPITGSLQSINKDDRLVSTGYSCFILGCLSRCW